MGRGRVCSAAAGALAVFEVVAKCREFNFFFCHLGTIVLEILSAVEAMVQTIPANYVITHFRAGGFFCIDHFEVMLCRNGCRSGYLILAIRVRIHFAASRVSALPVFFITIRTFFCSFCVVVFE